MNKKFTNFLTGIAIAAGMISAAASSASVATVPTGMITYPLVQGTTNYLSLPLTNTETYTSTVNAVSSNTIAVSDTPAPFTTSLAVSGAPYFVKFLSGNEAGRVMLITSNTPRAPSPWIRRIICPARRFPSRRQALTSSPATRLRSSQATR
jgi:hypothetical protein